MEATGRLPIQMSIALLAPSPEPTGGFRPIGFLFRGVDFGAEEGGPTGLRGPTEGLRTSFGGKVSGLRLEPPQGWSREGVLRPSELDFPPFVFRVCLAAYKSCRFLSLGGIIEGPFWVVSGVIAGRSMATAFIRAFAIESFGRVVLSCGTNFDAYVDDAGLSHTGTVTEVVDSLAAASKSLHHEVTAVLGCKLALDKVGCVCSRRAVALQLEEQLGELRGKPSSSIVNMGVDCVAGRSLRTTAPGYTKSKARKVKVRQAAFCCRKCRRLDWHKK
eukprot:7255471-Pyramimonas_sp.AAC.1